MVWEQGGASDDDPDTTNNSEESGSLKAENLQPEGATPDNTNREDSEDIDAPQDNAHDGGESEDRAEEKIQKQLGEENVADTPEDAGKEDLGGNTPSVDADENRKVVKGENNQREKEVDEEVASDGTEKEGVGKNAEKKKKNEKHKQA